jgi:creatine kinase/arginine kinase
MADKRPSLMEKHLTPEVRAALAGVRTSNGFTLDDVIRSGVENPDSSVGAYAGDEESYAAFAPLLDPIIAEYHGFPKEGVHVRDFDPAKLDMPDLDPEGKYILSTRVRVGRNLAGFPFAPAITREQRDEVERRVVSALASLTGDLAGTYYPLSGMSEETRQQLIADHFLFKQGDRFLESAGANRDWPVGRGIFHSADKRFLTWVNEEDQLRIISMQKGSDLLAVFDRLARAVNAIEAQLPFAVHPRYGCLSSCPTNLGTAMRASVHVRLPHLADRPEFKAACDEMKLSIRGIHGEHSDSEGGVFDISNKQRLGVSEVEAAMTMYRGVKRLIEMDKAFEREAEQVASRA